MVTHLVTFPVQIGLRRSIIVPQVPQYNQTFAGIEKLQFSIIEAHESQTFSPEDFPNTILD